MVKYSNNLWNMDTVYTIHVYTLKIYTLSKIRLIDTEKTSHIWYNILGKVSMIWHNITQVTDKFSVTIVVCMYSTLEHIAMYTCWVHERVLGYFSVTWQQTAYLWHLQAKSVLQKQLHLHKTPLSTTWITWFYLPFNWWWDNELLLCCPSTSLIMQHDSMI